jgi:hypothetical protein
MSHEELAKLAEELVEIAKPVEQLLGKRAVNRWVQRFEAKGFSPLAARCLIELQSMRVKYIGSIRRSP